MTMSKIVDDAFRSLERAKEAAQHRLQELDAERDELKASLKSLNGALNAFSKAAVLAEAPTRRAPTTPMVIERLAAILSAVGPWTMERAELLVAEQLQAAGLSRAGLKLRLQQAVKDNRFLVTPKGISLRPQATSPTESPS
jgi:hypothetical protein